MDLHEELQDGLFAYLLTDAEENERGDPANVVDGLFAIARAIRFLANRLGTGNASTDLGGMEAIAREIKDGFEELAGAVRAHD